VHLGLGQELAQILSGVTMAGSPDEVARGSWDTVVVASLSLRTDGAETVRALHRQFGRRLVVVGIGSPYELLRFPEVETYLTTYGPDPVSLRAAARRGQVRGRDSLQRPERLEQLAAAHERGSRDRESEHVPARQHGKGALTGGLPRLRERHCTTSMTRDDRLPHGGSRPLARHRPKPQRWLRETANPDAELRKPRSARSMGAVGLGCGALEE